MQGKHKRATQRLVAYLYHLKEIPRIALKWSYCDSGSINQFAHIIKQSNVSFPTL